MEEGGDGGRGGWRKRGRKERVRKEERERGEEEERRGVMCCSKVKTNRFSHLLFKESPSSGRCLILCSGGRIWYSGSEGHLTASCTPV